MSTTLDWGTLRLDLLPDGTGEVPGADVFYPAAAAEWGADLEARGLRATEQGGLTVAVQALLVREGDQLTVVDTGWGEAHEPERAETVLRSLARLGVQPKDVARVILTHAHGDHVMGNTLPRDGASVPAFPLAEYLIQESELEAARKDSAMWEAAFQPLVARGQVRAIHGRAEISPALTCWPTPGHTIGHQSVLVRTPERPMLFVGDLAIWALNMERLEWGHSWAWSLAVDRDSRREVAEWACDESATLILGHDPANTLITLERAGAGYRAHRA